MSEQYLRQWSLQLLNLSGGTADLSQLKIRFAIRQADIQTPNSMWLRIYNLSRDTRNRILAGEYTAVTLQAGYADGTNYGLVFSGSIRYSARGRDNATDTYVELSCADGDTAYNQATMGADNAGVSIAAGSTPMNHVAAALTALSQHGITQGFINQLPANGLARGKVMFGMARDYLRIITRTYGVSWSIINGQLQMVSLNSYAPGQAVVLTSNTGLIGMPRQEPDGIHARCLLNPNIKLGQLVQIDNRSITQYLLPASFSAPVTAALLPEVADDGIYNVFVVEHSGDTRGQDWYTDMICVKAGDAIPVALTERLVSYGATS